MSLFSLFLFLSLSLYHILYNEYSLLYEEAIFVSLQKSRQLNIHVNNCSNSDTCTHRYRIKKTSTGINSQLTYSHQLTSIHCEMLHTYTVDPEANVNISSILLVESFLFLLFIFNCCTRRYYVCTFYSSPFSVSTVAHGVTKFNESLDVTNNGVS